ncbi:DUF1102 domain-containing protein [Haloparvum sedimenti]|uniref:DUF1102 domain-containing protein n=1 Tax=Haloparvum sedimenti TaxID=1678448 RepID=UPI00071E9D64|nr:DUF1102 domain-containing protein [Haloparvum sedimenti]
MSTRRRSAILALLLLAAASLALTTGATVIDGPADTVAGDRVAIQPADGPNGEYAYLDEDDEIVVDISATNPNLPADFEGVNPDSTGTIEDVFTITYTTDRYAHVWIEHDGDDVTFLVDGEPIEGEANNATLAQNESVAVGLAFDTTGNSVDAQLGADEFSIHAEVAEPEAVADATGSVASPTTTTVRSPNESARVFEATGVDAGESVAFDLDRMALAGTNVTLDGVTVTRTRAGAVDFEATGSPTPFAEAGELDAPAGAAANAYLSLSYDLDPDAVESATFRFSVDPEDLEDRGIDPEDLTLYRRAADGWTEKNVTVIDPETADAEGLDGDRVHFEATTENLSVFAVATHRPRFQVRDAHLADDVVAAGDGTTVNATVANTGGADGERTMRVTLDGEVHASTTVRLESRDETTVSLPVAPEDAGVYQVNVDGRSAGTLAVEAAADGDAEDAAGTADPAGTGDGGGGEGISESGGEAGADETTDAPGGGAPVDEPGGFGLSGAFGLIAGLVVTLAALALARRVPQAR